MDYFKDVPGLNESGDMKKVKKLLFQAHQKLGAAATEIDSKANPAIADKILKMQQQIEKLNTNIN